MWSAVGSSMNENLVNVVAAVECALLPSRAVG